MNIEKEILNLDIEYQDAAAEVLQCIDGITDLTEQDKLLRNQLKIYDADTIQYMLNRSFLNQVENEIANKSALDFFKDFKGEE